jgi:site-specific DNA-methyltransferase (adenine-specific)
MEPYWQGRYSTLYHGNCFDIMPLMKSGSMQLLCCDPPYGQDWQSGLRRHKKMRKIDGDISNEFDLEKFGNMSTRLLQNCRHVYVFGFRPDQIAEHFSLGGSCELIWDKGQIGPGDLSSQWGPQHEPITFGMYVSGKVNKAKGYGGLSARLRQGSVLSFSRLNSRAVKIHPTQKPVPLMRALIESSSNLGDMVFDPACGVGSTLVAATIGGRFSTGIELDEEYCDIAATRLEQAEKLVDQIKQL